MDKPNIILNAGDDKKAAPEIREESGPVIQTGKSSLTFINTWTATDLNTQRLLIAAIKEDSPVIQKQKGFDGMAFYISKEGRQLVVFAQWKTEEDFKIGIEQNAIMVTAREKLVKFGSPSSNTYLTDSIYQMAGINGSWISFIQTWKFINAENQRHWLETMKENIGILRSKTGFVAMVLYRSIDGLELVVYAQWQNEELMKAALTDPKAKAGHAAMVKWSAGEAIGNIYHLESLVMPPK